MYCKKHSCLYTFFKEYIYGFIRISNSKRFSVGFVPTSYDGYAGFGSVQLLDDRAKYLALSITR